MSKSKFETTETLIYEHLIYELDRDIEYTEARIEMLIRDNDFENAKLEELQILKDKEKLKHLEQYLKESKKFNSSRPNFVDIGWYDEFSNKKIVDQLNAIQLDDSDYYYKPTNITLNEWRKMEEGVVYIFNNLTLIREGDTLLSKYPQESMWHELHEDYEADSILFKAHGDKKLFLK